MTNSKQTQKLSLTEIETIVEDVQETILEEDKLSASRDMMVEGTCQRIIREIANAAEISVLDAIENIPNSEVRISCDECGFTETFRSVRQLRERGHDTHEDHPDYDCTADDVSYEAVCPRHGVIPLAYDECDDCYDSTRAMNDL